MTILTATEYRTIDASTGDVHFGFSNVRPGVEEGTCVTLTSTKEVTGHGVSGNLFQGTRHTECCRTTKVDGTQTSRIRYRRLTRGIVVIDTYISQLITSIDTGQDVTTGNIQYDIATN